MRPSRAAVLKRSPLQQICALLICSKPSSLLKKLGAGFKNISLTVEQAVNDIVLSKTFDNGMICASEQSVIVHNKVYDNVKKEFKARGCYFLSEEETEKLRKMQNFQKKHLHFSANFGIISKRL